MNGRSCLELLNGPGARRAALPIMFSMLPTAPMGRTLKLVLCGTSLVRRICLGRRFIAVAAGAFMMRMALTLFVLVLVFVFVFSFILHQGFL